MTYMAWEMNESCSACACGRGASVDYALSRPDVDAGGVRASAKHGGVVALFAAALDARIRTGV